MATDSISLNALHPEHDTTAALHTAAERVVNALVAARSSKSKWTVTLENDGGSANAKRCREARELNAALADLEAAVEADDESAPCLVTESIARRAANLGYFCFCDDSDGITIEKIGEPDAEGLLGGSLKEAGEWLDNVEQRRRAEASQANDGEGLRIHERELAAARIDDESDEDGEATRAAGSIRDDLENCLRSASAILNLLSSDADADEYITTATHHTMSLVEEARELVTELHDLAHKLATEVAHA